MGFRYLEIFCRIVYYGTVHHIMYFGHTRLTHIQAFILNRVQNIVVPPRNPLTLHHQRLARRQPRTAVLSYILGNIFPVDLSTSFSRLVFRVPSIYLLSRTLLLWTIVLLQTLHRFPTWQWSWLQTVDSWSNQKTMDDICWFTFISVCAALFISALTSGMDGQNSSNNTPFNLVSWYFQNLVRSE